MDNRPFPQEVRDACFEAAIALRATRQDYTDDGVRMLTDIALGYLGIDGLLDALRAVLVAANNLTLDADRERISSNVIHGARAAVLQWAEVAAFTALRVLAEYAAKEAATYPPLGRCSSPS